MVTTAIEQDQGILHTQIAQQKDAILVQILLQHKEPLCPKHLPICLKARTIFTFALFLGGFESFWHRRQIEIPVTALKQSPAYFSVARPHLFPTALSNPLKRTVPENYLPAEEIIIFIHITSLFMILLLLLLLGHKENIRLFFPSFFFSHSDSRGSRSQWDVIWCLNKISINFRRFLLFQVL